MFSRTFSTLPEDGLTIPARMSGQLSEAAKQARGSEPSPDEKRVRDMWQKGQFLELSDMLNDMIAEVDAVKSSELEGEELDRHKHRLRLYYNTQSLSLNKLGKYQGAIRFADQFIDKHTAADPEPYAAKAQSYFAMHQYEKAVECLNKLIQLKPDEPETVVNKTICFFQLGRFDECLQWVEIGHRLIQQRLELGQAGLEDPFGELALERTLGKESQDSGTNRLKMWAAELNSIKAGALVKQSNWIPAIKAANLALAFNDRHLKALEAKALAQVESGQHSDAVVTAQRLIDLEPENLPGLHLKARALAQAKRIGEAVTAFDQVIHLSLRKATDTSKIDITPILQKSALLSILGRNDDALAVAREALNYKPRDFNIHAQIGYCLTRLTRLEEAKKAYEDALACDANFKEAHINIGVISERLGRFNEGIGHYRKALEIDPKNAMALMNLARVQVDHFKNYPEAIETANQLIKVDPKSVEALMIQAKAYASLGMRQHANACAQRAFELRPELMKTAQEEMAKMSAAGGVKPPTPN